MISVFSKRKDKPHAYGFLEATAGTEDPNSVGFNPIEIAISADTKHWVSIYDVPDLDGVLVADTPYVAEAKQTDEYQKIGINDGQSLLSSSYAQREIKMLVVFEGMNRADTELAFDALQRYLVMRDPYWICFANWPQRMYYVKVSEISPTHLTDLGFTVEVTFTDQIGLSRSVGTTASWQTDAVIGFGNNQPLELSQYSFTSSHFVVKNLSDVLIDPERRGHPFKMTLSGASGGGMKVTNKTTGDEISRKGSFSGTWVLDAVNPELNGKGDLLNTDMGVITLQVGSNDFQVDNFSGSISFDFPMWWLS